MAKPLKWGVVGTMDEPAPLILSWVAHHLSIGAAEAHVFLDRPNTEVTEKLRNVPGAFVTVCDEAYWTNSTRGERPKRHTGRQKHNATLVYNTRKLDWLLHCDADEFLLLDQGFVTELANSNARTLRLKNWERVRTGSNPMIYSGAFRGVNFNVDLLETVYGRWSEFLDAGMAGYHDGKDIVRMGENFTMGVHFPIDMDTNERHKDKTVNVENAKLLHFDGLTPLHILLKLMKRASEPKYQSPRKFGIQRDRQIRFARHHLKKPKQMRKMVDEVFGVTEAQSLALGESFMEIEFDPRTALQQIGLSEDLSVQTFDAELREREADLIAATGLEWP